MKKIALLTFIRSTNYGASLQAYALWHAVKRMDNDVECKYINYRRNYKNSIIKWFFRKLVKGILRQDDTPSYSFIEFIHTLFLRSKTRSVFSDELNNKFLTFWNMCDYTRPLNKRELNILNNSFDAFIVGSDQVWNPGKVDLDSTFLLNFVKDNNKKYSYASSFGIEEIPDKYKNKYRELLNDFKMISVRESSAQEMIYNLLPNRSKESVCVNCDPTLLLDKDEWKSVIVKTHIDLNTPYVLVYDLDENDEICMNIAKMIAKENQCDVYRISYANADGPMDWLQRFLSARYVVTNSFHGTAFSLNFSKPFISLVPNTDFYNKSSSRIESLLKIVGLTDRMMYESDLVKLGESSIIEHIIQLPDIDYENIQRIIDRIRNEGLNYIHGCLK